MTVLAAIEYGEGRPVAILHGLFGSARNWAGIARRLGLYRRAIALDLRNHGASPRTAKMSYAEMVEDVRATMVARGHRRFALIGHSLGGKVAMTAALAYGADIERLIVVDMAPVPYPVVYLPYVQAMRGLDLAAISRRSEADARLATAIPDPAERAFLLQNLVLGSGPPRWQLNLAAIEQALPTLSGFSAMPPGSTYGGPALFISGENSDYLRPEHDAAVHRLFPNATLARIAGAGHWVHADQPEAFLDTVELFLAGRPSER
jgi:pimeloyl-ACP methyl ester carboxylesterase